MAWIPPYVAQVPTAITAVALLANRSNHSLVVRTSPVSGSLPKPQKYPPLSLFSCSLGIDPSTTRTNGSSSPLSALYHHLMKVSAPCSGPHSKSINGQCTAILGSPGSAPRAISSMLGCVAVVRATESPSQPSPPFIQRIWTTPSSSWVCRLSAVVVVTVAHLLCGDAHAPTSSAGCCCDQPDFTPSDHRRKTGKAYVIRPFPSLV